MKLAINGGEPFRKIKLQYGKQTIDERKKTNIPLYSICYFKLHHHCWRLYGIQPYI